MHDSMVTSFARYTLVSSILHLSAEVQQFRINKRLADDLLRNFIFDNFLRENGNLRLSLTVDLRNSWLNRRRRPVHFFGAKSFLLELLRETETWHYFREIGWCGAQSLKFSKDRHG